MRLFFYSLVAGCVLMLATAFYFDPPLDSPVPFAVSVFEATKLQQMEKLEPFYPSFLVTYEVFDVDNLENGNTTDDDKKMNNKKMLRFQMERIENIQKSFTNVKNYADSLRLNLKNAVIEDVEYTIHKKGNHITCNIDVNFFLQYNMYTFRLENCIKVKSGWVLGRNFYILR